jgi:Outer membrane protein beta-barrel domain
MNKNIRLAGLVILLVSGLCHLAQADETPSPPIRLGGLYTYFGVQGGINFATLSGDGSNILGSRTGFQAGVDLDIQYSPWFSVMPELRYSQRGFSFANSNTTGSLNYIELPILAKFNMAPGSDLSPFVFIGPNFSFKTGGDAITIGGGSFNTFDFGLDFGAGLQYQINFQTRAFIDFEYYDGLTDISSGSDLRNSVPEINIGFAWAL